MKNKSLNGNFKKYGIIIMIIILVVILIFGGIKVIKCVKDSKRDYSLINIDYTDYKYFITNDKGRVGVIDDKANVILEPQYDNIIIPNPEKDIFICIYNYDNKNKTYNVKTLNSKNEELFTNYQEVDAIAINGTTTNLPYEKNVLKYKENDKYGLIDLDGNIVVNAIYDELDSLKYREGEFKVKQNNKYGVINNKGYKMLSFKYDFVEGDKYNDKDTNYKNGGYIVGLQKDDAINFLYGYVDKYGKEVLDIQYQKISRFVNVEDKKNAYLNVKINDKYTIFKNNKKLNDGEYDNIYYNSEAKVFIASNSDFSGVIDLKGKEIISVEQELIDIQGKYIKVKNGDNVEYFNLHGEKIDNLEYSKIIGTSNEKYDIVVDKNNKYGLNCNDKLIINNKYSYMEYLYDNYFIVEDDNSKFGVIDEKDGIKIKIEYDSISKIQFTKALVCKKIDNKISDIYTSKLEKIATGENVNISTITSNNIKYLELYMSGITKYINENGENVSIKDIIPNVVLFVKNKDGKFGYVDESNNLKINYIFDEATEFNIYGYAAVKKDGLWGVINKDGKLVVEPKFKYENGKRPDFIGEYQKCYYGYGQIYYIK